MNELRIPKFENLEKMLYCYIKLNVQINETASQTFEIVIPNIDLETEDQIIRNAPQISLAESEHWFNRAFDEAKDFAMWFMKVKGHENTIFTPYKLKMYSMFSKNSEKIRMLVRALHIHFYGEKIHEDF